MFTLVVELNVKPEMRERFLEAIERNAAASLREHVSRWRRTAAVCLREDGGQANTSCTSPRRAHSPNPWRSSLRMVI
jgi:hypothetical protein